MFNATTSLDLLHDLLLAETQPIKSQHSGQPKTLADTGEAESIRQSMRRISRPGPAPDTRQGQGVFDLDRLAMANVYVRSPLKGEFDLNIHSLHATLQIIRDKGHQAGGAQFIMSAINSALGQYPELQHLKLKNIKEVTESRIYHSQNLMKDMQADPLLKAIFTLVLVSNTQILTKGIVAQQTGGETIPLNLPYHEMLRRLLDPKGGIESAIFSHERGKAGLSVIKNGHLTTPTITEINPETIAHLTIYTKDPNDRRIDPTASSLEKTVSKIRELARANKPNEIRMFMADINRTLNENVELQHLALTQPQQITNSIFMHNLNFQEAARHAPQDPLLRAISGVALLNNTKRIAEAFHEQNSGGKPLIINTDLHHLLRTLIDPEKTIEAGILNRELRNLGGSTTISNRENPVIPHLEQVKAFQLKMPPPARLN